MDKQDKKGDFSIRTTFRKWLQIEPLQNAVLLFGNTYLGKTTICQLTKKFIDHIQDTKLKFVQKKKDFEYQYEGQINPKSTKPLTIYPKVYHMQSTNTNIIQIPSRIYQLQKKRTYLDKILNIIGLVYATKKAKFLFCVDSKNTSGRCDPWKRSFQCIFDCFKEQFLNENTFQSIGFIITKAPIDHNKDIYISRMPDIEPLFKDEPRKFLYLQLIKTIQENKRIQVFTKIASQNRAQNDILQISQMYKKLNYTDISTKNNFDNQGHNTLMDIEATQLVKDEQIFFIKYQQPLENILIFFAQLFKKLFTTSGAINMDQFLNQKNNDLQNLIVKITQDEKSDGEWSKIVINQYNKLSAESNKNKDFFQTVLGKVSLFLDYKQNIQNIAIKSSKTLKQLLNILSKYGLILDKTPQIKFIYLQLIQYSIFQERFGSFITNLNFNKLLQEKNVNYEFRKAHEEALKIQFLDQPFSSQQKPQKATSILKILNKLFPQDNSTSQQKQKISLIKNIMMLSSFDTKKPQQNLPLIFNLIEEFIYDKKLPETIYLDQLQNPIKQIELLNKLALLLAQMLKNYGRSDLCAQIYKDNGYYHSAKVCLQIKLKQIKSNQQKIDLELIERVLMSYLDLLIQMSLSQKALQCCFENAQQYKQLRQKIWIKMKKIKQKPNISFNQYFEKQFLRKGVQLINFYKNNELLGEIKNIVNRIKKQKVKLAL